MKIIASCTCRIALFQLQLFEPSFETSVSSGNALFALKLVYLYLLHTWLSWRVMLWRKQKTSRGTVRYELTVAKHRRTCQLTKCPQPETVAPFSRTTWPYQTHVAPVSRTKWPYQDTIAAFSRTKCLKNKTHRCDSLWCKSLKKRRLKKSMLYEPDREQSRSPTCIWNILFFRTGSRTFPITNFHLYDCIETFFFPPIPQQSSPNLAYTVWMLMHCASFFSWRSMSPSTPKTLHKLHPRIVLGS